MPLRPSRDLTDHYRVLTLTISNYEPHECDLCPGTVKPLRADREPIKVCGHMVVIDGPTIGKCNRCGHRYFPADIVKKAEKAALDGLDRLME